MPRERDPLWQHVDELPGNRWKCKYCEKVAAGGLTRIKAHFAKVKKLGITVCQKVSHRVRSEAQRAMDGEKATESSNRQGNVGCSSNLTQGPHQLVSASNEDARRETSYTATLYRSSDDIRTAGTSSSAYVSVPGTNFPNQSLPAPTMIRQRDTTFWPQPPQSRAGDFCTERWNLSHASSSRDLTPEAFANMWRPPNAEVGNLSTEVPQGDMPRAMDPLLDWVYLNEYTGGPFTDEHFAGDGGYWIPGCKAIDGRVGSEALQTLRGKRAVESSNRQGNVEGLSNLTQGPHQLVSASNEDARRDTSFAGALYRSSAVLSTTVAGSSAFVSVPATCILNQSCSAQTMIRQRDTQFRPQSPQFHAGDFDMYQWNSNYPSSSLALTLEALASMQRPLNAEVGDLNTDVRQGKMPGSTHPSLERAGVLNEYAGGPFIEEHFAGDGGYGTPGYNVVNGRVISETLQASKHTRAVESSNRQGNVEGPPVITQGPHQLVSGSNKDAQRETAFVATPSRSSDVGSTAERGNLSHASGSQDFTSEGLANMWHTPNVEVGDPNTEVPQGANTELASAEGELGTYGIADENTTSHITKRDELIISGDADLNKLIWKWNTIKEECRSPTLEKVAEMEEFSKKLKGFFDSSEGCNKSLPC